MIQVGVSIVGRSFAILWRMALLAMANVLMIALVLPGGDAPQQQQLARSSRGTVGREVNPGGAREERLRVLAEKTAKDPGIREAMGGGKAGGEGL